MTPIFFLAMYGFGLLAALFRNPIFGLYTYFFTFYMSPADAWWRSSVPDLRYLLIAAVVTMIAILRMPPDPDRAPWYKTGGGRLLAMFVIWFWIGSLWAISRDDHIDGAVLFSKHLIVFFLIYKMADSLDRIRAISVAHIIGSAWFGYLALDAGSGRLEDIGGAVAGSNELGVHVSTALLFGGILMMTTKGKVRWIIFACLPLILNCLILTVSRGAFLGLISAGIAAYALIPGSLRGLYKLFAVLGVVLFFMLAHDAIIERFTATYHALTSESSELDHSAMSRKAIAEAGWEIALDYPLGAGNKATEILSPRYMPANVLQRDSKQRAAHTAVMGIVAELGFPALAIYLGMVIWAMIIGFRFMAAPNTPEVEALRPYAAYVVASLAAIYVSGLFSSNEDLETQFWCLALLAAVSDQLRQALARNPDAEPAAEGGPRRGPARRPGPAAHPRYPRYPVPPRQ